ncbi:hypothetical protein [Sphaerochaeta sp. PS]|uniref:hypothetical protein n=1 Tax=Sphaerochaeta sp. PS TaxID=3076336 RepID=UPI0028A534BF|nr:hypothetical protein [Sphaerochaeta sp. PS]MDT4762178.1 hypothetical protein [Sphaerochaeta sp. PS]
MRYTPHYLLLDEEQSIVTTPFLLEILDSALIENIQMGNIQAAYGVLDLSISLAQATEKDPLSALEGQQILAKVKRAMERGNIASAKQHMVEFALRP